MTGYLVGSTAPASVTTDLWPLAGRLAPA